MTGMRSRIWTLAVSLMLPGFFAWSCTGTAVRKFRDASVDAAADAVGGRVFELVAEALAPPTEEEAADD